MSELFTWEYLATLAGCIVGTGILVQLFKEKIPLETRLLSYLVALVIFNVAALCLGLWTWQGGLKSLLDAGIVALASNGGFDAIQRLKSVGSNTEGNG
jgi:hypothetical protein